ncbi:MAG: hypothetical protein GX442_25655 [Candidatus Riflebacteria bacterium]|nr:hypothetical protein [Candidatus Riflebacteria bacterium]
MGATRQRSRGMARRGFSFPEMIISFGLSLLAILLISRVFQGVQHQFRRSWVDVQSFHEAQLAITSLRRDFSGACPLLRQADGRVAMKLALLRPIQETGGAAPASGGALVTIGPRQVSFHRFTSGTGETDPEPRVERIEYRLDPAENRLIRQAGTESRVFRGIRDAEFRVYVHPLDPGVPLLWVRLSVLERPLSGVGSTTTGLPLELTTTLQSVFLHDVRSHPDWNYDTFHRP